MNVCSKCESKLEQHKRFCTQSASFALPTALATELHLIPVLGPLLSPFKFELTIDTDFGVKPVFCLG